MTKINEKKQLVNLPVPIERINGNEAGLLNVVKKTITVSKEDFNKPQEWMEQLTRSIESAFTCKSECIAATPPIIRHTDPTDLNSQMEITSIVIDVSDVLKKEGLCQ